MAQGSHLERREEETGAGRGKRVAAFALLLRVLVKAEPLLRECFRAPAGVIERYLGVIRAVELGGPDHVFDVRVGQVIPAIHWHFFAA